MKYFCRTTGTFLALIAFTASASSLRVISLGAIGGQFHGPARLAADAAAKLYVTDPAAGRVTVFDVFGQRCAVHEGFAKPLAIAVASDGQIYLSEEQIGRVLVFDSQWNPLYQLGAGTNEFELPAHLAVDPLAPDTVYVSDGAANVVRVYSGATQVGQFGSAGVGDGQFRFPAGIVVRPNGEVLVVDQDNDRVEVFTNNVFARKFALGDGGMSLGPSGRSQALFVDQVGRVFVADTLLGQVKVFDAVTGSQLGTIGEFGGARGQLNLPLGLALDRFHRLCVASANNARLEFFGVDDFLHFSTDAANGLLGVGNNLVFRVVVGGTNGASFQWQKNGANLSGATNATLVFTNAGTSDGGGYSVIISNASGVVTSSVTSVSVLLTPGILAGPADQTVQRGATVNWSVLATGSDLRFQWFFNGQALAEATNASLTLGDVQSEQAGQYSVRVSNSLGGLTTAPANLTVLAPPLVMDLVAATLRPDRTFQLTLNVEPGYGYELQATTNLAAWSSITNFTADGWFDWTDVESTNLPSRVYRLHWLPPPGN